MTMPRSWAVFRPPENHIYRTLNAYSVEPPHRSRWRGWVLRPHFPHPGWGTDSPPPALSPSGRRAFIRQKTWPIAQKIWPELATYAPRPRSPWFPRKTGFDMLTTGPGRPVETRYGKRLGPSRGLPSRTIAPLPKPAASTDSARWTFTVSMQPGNNYRAGASCLQDAINQANQTIADALNAQGGQCAGYTVPLEWSRMLTVWRKLWVEADSMAAVDA